MHGLLSLKVAALVIWLVLLTGACKPDIRTPAPTVSAPATQTPPASLSALPTPTVPHASSVTTSTASAPNRRISPTANTTETLAYLGGFRCPGSRFTCITLTLPSDHFVAAGPVSQTIDVVFAVLPASGIRKGMFVVAVGGPGSSGVALADSYTSAFDPTIAENFDLVFFDQRGTGLSAGINCPNGTATYYQSEASASTSEMAARTIAAAREFANRCIAEIGGADKVSHLDTHQAAEDLESFRQAMGIDKFWIYGESYGTQLAQVYAASYASHLAGMVLDGTVDLTLSGADFAKGSAQAFDDVLVQTLTSCNTNAACAKDTGGDAVKAYDTLLARLAAGPITATFPLPSGRMVARPFNRGELDTAVSGYLNRPDNRMLLQRALAAAAHDDLVPLTRLLYLSASLNEETLQAIPDPMYSDAAYYAVTCSDYSYFNGTPEQRAQAYIDSARSLNITAPRLSSVYFGDLPCVFWPGVPNTESRAVPLKAQGVPTLVLGATADPLTPIANGESVYRNLKDGYMITTRGGAHVTFGRGDACPDKIVVAFLVKNERPPHREIQCEGTFATDYIPIAPQSVQSFATPLDTMQSLRDELMNLPEYANWDGAMPLKVGCSRGGTLSVGHKSITDTFSLQACAFTSGFSATGSGTYDNDAQIFKLEVNVSGSASGKLSYIRDTNGLATLTGNYAGRNINLTSGR
jgi:pimeloyl-ACP methyl ester carboxylesterase